MATSPLVWMRAVRDHVPKPPANSSRLVVLVCLALRMSKDGTGFASQSTLAGDTGVSVATVKRHLRWARETGYLVQTKRGNRTGDGDLRASVWRLATPSLGVTGAPLTPVSRGQTGDVKGSSSASLGVTGDPPRGPYKRSSHQAAPAAATNGHHGDPQSADGGGTGTHEHEPNARRALAALRADRALPLDPDRLLDLAYTAGHGDPWTGYLAVKAATDQTLDGARDPAAVLRKRLGLTGTPRTQRQETP